MGNDRHRRTFADSQTPIVRNAVGPFLRRVEISDATVSIGPEPLWPVDFGLQVSE